MPKLATCLKFNFDAFTQEKIPCGNLFRVLHYISPKRTYYTYILCCSQRQRWAMILFFFFIRAVLLVCCCCCCCMHLGCVFLVHLGSSFSLFICGSYNKSYSYVTHFRLVYCNWPQCTAMHSSNSGSSSRSENTEYLYNSVIKLHFDSMPSPISQYYSSTIRLSCSELISIDLS